MPFGFAAGALVTAGGAYLQSEAAKDAAGAQAEGYGQSIAEQRRQYEQTRTDQLPFLEAGYDALRAQNAALKGDFSGFQDAPDYAYALQQGLQSQERGAAARGGFTGGGADADRIALAEGLAGQNFGNYWNRLAGRAGQGQTAATNLGQLGQGYAGNIGQAYQGIGNARASGYLNQANAWDQAAGNLATGFGQWYGGLGQDEQGRYLGKQRGPG